jgi:hypothetical protein
MKSASHLWIVAALLSFLSLPEGVIGAVTLGRGHGCFTAFEGAVFVLNVET